MVLTTIGVRPGRGLMLACLAVVVLALLLVPLKQLLIDGTDYRQTAHYKLAACQTLNAGEKRPNNLVIYLSTIAACMDAGGFAYSVAACPTETDAAGNTLYTRAEDFNCYSRQDR